MTNQFGQFLPTSYYSPNGSSNSGENWRSEKLESEPKKIDTELEYKLHPKECNFDQITKHSCIQINTIVELAFLQTVTLNQPFDFKVNGLAIPKQLMTVLNQYGIGEGWSRNPRQGNSVANFSLLYYGIGSRTPEQYKLNNKSPLVAIIEVDTFNGKEVLSLAVR